MVEDRSSLDSVGHSPVRRRQLLVLISLLAIAGAAWFGWPRLFGPIVVVAPPERGPAIAAVYATGTVEPVTWAQVQPLVSAQIISFAAEEGQRVRAGDILARLDDAGERARLAELQARTAFLEKEGERYRRLVEDRTVSLQTWERVVSDLQQAQAALAVVRERLADFTIVAPISGDVLRREREIGEVVGPADIIFWIGQPRPLHIEAEVDEEDIPRVAPGEAALIKSDAFPGEVFDGKVERITPLGDPVNKSFRVYIAIPDESPLRIGMTVEVNIVTRFAAEAWLVPTGAVRDGHVFIIEDDRVRRQPVESGIVGPQHIEIRNGVTAQDQIVAAPPADLADGTRVRTRRLSGETR